MKTKRRIRRKTTVKDALKTLKTEVTYDILFTFDDENVSLIKEIFPTEELEYNGKIQTIVRVSNKNENWKELFEELVPMADRVVKEDNRPEWELDITSLMTEFCFKAKEIQKVLDVKSSFKGDETEEQKYQKAHARFKQILLTS